MNKHLRSIEAGCSERPVSCCRFCQNYKQLKDQIGFCQQLNAAVVGKWESCRLAVPTFAPSWESKRSINHI